MAEELGITWLIDPFRLTKAIHLVHRLQLLNCAAAGAAGAAVAVADALVTTRSPSMDTPTTEIYVSR